MATPNWIGASTGSQPLAAQTNQFLGTHAITYVYTGTSFSTQSTTGSGGTNSFATWLAQSFTTGGSTTSVGRARINLSFTGSPTPMTLSLYANSAGAPTGAPLASTVVPSAYLTAGGATVSIPVPASGLAVSTTYWLVIPALGDASNYVTWTRNNQVSGASTSTNGTTWAAQAYGFIYNVFDQSVIPPLAHTWEDAGVRWTAETINAANEMTKLQEYTVAQAANDYVYSSRTLTYDSTGSNLVSVA